MTSPREKPGGPDDSKPHRRPSARRTATLWAAAAAMTFLAILLVARFGQHRGWAFTLALVWSLTALAAALLGRAASRWERHHPPPGTGRPPR